MKNSTDNSCSLTLSFDIHFTRNINSKTIRNGKKPIKPTYPEPKAHILRITKLLALAHHFDSLLKSGAIKDYADIARLGGVSRARVTQIMNLLLLAPVIQEAILFSTPQSKESITERKIRDIAKEPEWKEQRRMFEKCFIVR